VESIVTTGAGAAACVVDRSAAGHVVPPVEWLAAVVEAVGADRVATAAWYRELAARLATGGRASGIVLFTNGNGEEVVLDMRVTRGADVELIARTTFFKAGRVSVDGWGPKLEGATEVKTTRMESHDGITIQDLLGQRVKALPSSEAPASSTTL
jgi:hypothetical protein